MVKPKKTIKKTKAAVKPKKKTEAKAEIKAKVVIYTSRTCTYSRLVKQFLERHNIKYVEKDVSKNHNTVQDLMKDSGQMGVPVVIIDGTVIVGYDEEAMKKALKIN